MITANGQMGDRFSFFESDLIAIEKWKPKANYEIPFFITTNGNHTTPTTLGEFTNGFPDFFSLDTGNLVNLKNVSKVEIGSYGGKVYFGETDIYTSVNKLNSALLPDIIQAAKKRPNDSRFILGTINSQPSLYPARDICFVDMCSPKRNYHVPRFHFKNSNGEVVLTFRDCKEAFPYLFPATPSHFINLNKVAGFNENSFGAVIKFKESDYTCPVSQSKFRMLKEYLANN
ncbi:hypothetical protein [Paenibacillus polymyxa]|uniref:hypothetical protein n=1 Tax=Paenibacillus polymyxa TaxID=1406 RepID=UPI00177B8454|nr:hypothetical protein [Paenibacillus polymyxa]QOH62377.1 hypothetical protein DI243_13720 [Paenibacillus polymyxa]